jgi:uncharacterized C2H2 Zn-finger protein
MKKTNYKRLFKEMNNYLKELEPDLGENIRCPLCGKIFGIDSIESELTLEHIPPRKTAKLISEITLKTLTCKKCNNTFGTKYQDDMKKYVINQLHWVYKYNRTIPGNFRLNKTGEKPINANILWDAKTTKISIVEKANSPDEIKLLHDKLKKMSEGEWEGTEFSVNLNYGYKRQLAWAGFLHSAYLALNVMSNGQYGYSDAGKELLKMLLLGETDHLLPCVIVPQVIGVGGRPWFGWISEPEQLKCYLVKIAGNLVILPLEQDITSCYKAWKNTSTISELGLVPNTKFRMHFRSTEDALEARKIIPKAFGNIPN